MTVAFHFRILIRLEALTMKFDELEVSMRVFETINDLCVLPGLQMVARLDGRGFTRLTKETHPFEAPFDSRFRDMMLATTEHLMTNSGFNFVYGYTQSDEISLLFTVDENRFQRKLRKLLSILSGEASAKFSLQLGDVGVFDCRICQFPSANLVVDYFRWRNEDAHRNALNAHCYWLLRKKGQTASEATAAISGLSVAAKNELLFRNGVNFNDLPLWQKRGSGLYWEEIERSAENPITGEKVVAIRKQLIRNLELPMKEGYSMFLTKLLEFGRS
jgi:tRNA(His) 5'-end guanylyltransferase